MKIVMVADQYPPVVGGAERQAQKLSQALAARGHEIVVLTGRWDRSMRPVDHEGDVTVERLSTLRSMGGIRGLRKYGRDWFGASLRRALRRRLRDADVVHAHFLQLGARVAIEEAAPLGVPVLVKETSSGSNSSLRRLPEARHGTEMLEFFYERLEHVGVLNPDAALEYESAPFRALNVHRISNGVDAPAPGSRWRGAHEKRVLFLGRLHPVKGAAELVEAFAVSELPSDGWSLRICGDGPERKALADLVSRHGLDSGVEFIERAVDPGAQLISCGILALPSRAEGMSNTLLEAMALGVPCVATDVGANSEMLEGDCGWIADAGSVLSLATNLAAAAKDLPERARRGERARARVLEKYVFEEVARKYETLYRSLTMNDDARLPGAQH